MDGRGDDEVMEWMGGGDGEVMEWMGGVMVKLWSGWEG